MSRLTHNDIHRIVGILSVASHRGDVEIILGDMVYDEASEKRRDIDITIKTTSPDDGVFGYMGYIGWEVKDEGEPLDVTKVEQLCLKLKDMPGLNHYAIISSSGFTDGAIKKARHHNVELYCLTTGPDILERIEFLGPDFRVVHLDKRWLYPPHVSFGSPGHDGSKFGMDTPIYEPDGAPNTECASLNEFKRRIEIQVFNWAIESEEFKKNITGTPFQVDIISPITEPYPYVMLNGDLRPITHIKIKGSIIEEEVKTELKMLTKEGEDKPVAGCAVGIQHNGTLIGSTYTNETRKVGIFIIPISERNKEVIRNIKIRTRDQTNIAGGSHD